VTRESAIVLCIPEAEALVGPWRRRYDSAAALGVPAHVTLLYPFVPPDELPGAEGELEALCEDAAPFDVTFRRTNRFGDQVLFLDPEPDSPVVDLIRRLSDRFGLEPYGGTIPLAEVKPHLTVVDGHPEAFEDVELAMKAGLPIAARVFEAWTLLSDEAGRWKKGRPIPFGPR
jgi:2'-5' RNA ligase